MADKTNGALIVSDDVLADLVGYAAKECYGVVGMTSPAPTSVQEGIAGLVGGLAVLVLVRPRAAAPANVPPVAEPVG